MTSSNESGEGVTASDLNPWGEKREVMALLGTALCSIQVAERVLRICMTYVLPKDGKITVESLERQTAEEAKKTLGYFLGQLRRRVPVQAGFDAELSEFLELRNKLVHHLYEVEGLNFATPEGREVAEAFILKACVKTMHITLIFVSLIQLWVDHVGLSSEDQDKEFLSELRNSYMPMLNSIFISNK